METVTIKALRSFIARNGFAMTAGQTRTVKKAEADKYVKEKLAEIVTGTPAPAAASTGKQ